MTPAAFRRSGVGARGLLATLAAVALVVSACSLGGDTSIDDGQAQETAPADEGSDQAGQVTTVATTVAQTPVTDPPRIATIEEMEEQWAAARGQVITRLRSQQYGIDDDDILNGPGAFEIDLDDCPRSWVDELPEEGPIKIGHSTAQTGNYASLSKLADGMGAYFDYVNRNGGVAGRQIEFVVRDDEYVADLTEQVVEELVEEDEVFSVTTFGALNSLAVYDYLSDECVPHPFVMSSHPAWGDPERHPWTTGFQLSFSSEAIIWGNWIKRNLADFLPVRVSAVVMDNDFGVVYEDAFGQWAEANSDVVSDFEPVRHDPTEGGVGEEIDEIADDEPEVFIIMSTGEACRSAMEEAADQGITDNALALFVPSVCKDREAYMTPVGDSADGFLVVGGGAKSTEDPFYADDPFVRFVNTELEAAGLDTAQGVYGIGFAQYAWAHVEAMRIAAELDGGLTRSNLILALRAMELSHPILLEGVVFATDGNRDAFFVEGSEISRFDVDEGAWVQLGRVIDINGRTANCTWNKRNC